MKESVQFELTNEFRDRFQQAINERDQLFIEESLAEVNFADITSLLYEFNSEESKYVLDILPLDVRAQIIGSLDSDTRKKFLTIYQPAEIGSVYPAPQRYQIFD